MRKHTERRKNGKKRITSEARGATTRPNETHQRARERDNTTRTRGNNQAKPKQEEAETGGAKTIKQSEARRQRAPQKYMHQVPATTSTHKLGSSWCLPCVKRWCGSGGGCNNKRRKATAATAEANTTSTERTRSGKARVCTAPTIEWHRVSPKLETPRCRSRACEPLSAAAWLVWRFFVHTHTSRPTTAATPLDAR